jgi:hypothetical protein
MSKTMKATLTKSISFVDFNGKACTLPAGQLIDVVQVKTNLISSDHNGQHTKETIGDFIGSVGHDSFDLGTDEFQLNS